MGKKFEDLTLEEQTAHLTFVATRIAKARKLGKFALRKELEDSSAFLKTLGATKEHFLIAVQTAEEVP